MRDLFRWVFGDPAQRTRSFLRNVESRLVQALVGEVPAWVEPAQLSLLGAAAAAVAATALALCKTWPGAVWLVPLAMAVNWFGLSLDLPLARSRGTEVPAVGMLHHLGELFSHLTLLVAYGFSPFLTMRSAIIVVVCYLLFSSYGYIRAATRHVEQMAYIGIGVTEFRLLLAFWPFAAIALGVPESLDDRLPAIDVAIIAMAALAVLGLVVKLYLDGRRMTTASRGDE